MCLVMFTPCVFCVYCGLISKLIVALWLLASSQRFPFFGGQYVKAYLSSNGYISFGGAADDFEGKISGVFSRKLGNPYSDKSTGTVHRFSRRPLLFPRISGLYTDLEPETNRTKAGTTNGYSNNEVSVMKIRGDGDEARLVVTFNNVPLDTSISGRGDDNWEGSTFQISLFPNSSQK